MQGKIYVPWGIESPTFLSFQLQYKGLNIVRVGSKPLCARRSEIAVELERERKREDRSLPTLTFIIEHFDYSTTCISNAAAIVKILAGFSPEKILRNNYD